uniref:Uncharacterized protein n=1 Tax=Arundo donax TaxID=35708 RepID=A0A0A9A2G9_ARUDO
MPNYRLDARSEKTDLFSRTAGIRTTTSDTLYFSLHI